jgi:hypothetical protein
MSSQNNQFHAAHQILDHKKDSDKLQADDQSNNNGFSNQKKKDFVLYVGTDKKDNNNSNSNGKGILERNSM